jgi:hypothetical protein
MYLLCVCAAQRCWVRLTPISPPLRFGTALIAHHRTGLGTESIPRPHLHRDWAHPVPHRTGLGTESFPRPHLHRDWAHPAHICTRTGLTPLTTGLASGRSPSRAHICTGTESMPRATSVSSLLPSGTSAYAQHRCDAAAQHNVLQPRALCCNRGPPVHDRSRCGRRLLQPTARRCASVQLIASDPSQAKAPPAES